MLRKASEFEGDFRVHWMAEGLVQRLLERRGAYAKYRWPVDDLKGFWDHERLQLPRRERRVFVHQCIRPKKQPERMVWDVHDTRRRPCCIFHGAYQADIRERLLTGNVK